MVRRPPAGCLATVAMLAGCGRPGSDCKTVEAGFWRVMPDSWGSSPWKIATRRRGAASSLRTSTEDRGTTRRIGISYAVAAEGPLLLRTLPLPKLPTVAAGLGLVLQAGGIALRTWSMRTLGASYTRTLRTEVEQQVIDTGPYRLVRHPGYAGSLLIWAGFALTSRSPLALPLVAGLLGDAYRRRIQAEEQLLERDLPRYAAYRRRTQRLVPFVW